MVRISFIMVSCMLLACQAPTSRTTVHKSSEDSTQIEQQGISFLRGGILKKMEKISGTTDTIFIEVNKPDSIHIILESTSDTANIRISQLFSPDGKADGPFGRELKYRFKNSGLFYITVNENLMVGNHYSGPYQVSIIYPTPK